MISILNTWNNGYLTIPVLLTLRNEGILDLLRGRALSLQQLAEHTRLDTDYLMVAIRLLVSIGWLEQTNGVYRLASGQYDHQIPDAIMEIMTNDSVSPQADEKYVKLFDDALEKIEKSWGKIEDLSFRPMLEGALLIPVILYIKKHQTDIRKAFEPPITRSFEIKLFHDKIQKMLVRIFLDRNWITWQNNELVLTDTGMTLIGESIRFATVVSYNIVLQHINTFIYRNEDLSADATKRQLKLHFIEELNVIASNIEHEKKIALQIKCKDETKIKEGTSVFCKRDYALNMPQMYWGGMSENWLLKELGDIHWAMISNGLGVKSDELIDSSGNRLYASFVRLRWESNTSLFSYKENNDISIHGELSRYGSKIFFSDEEIVSSDKKIRASLMSVFSSRTAEDNTTLQKGTPLITVAEKINKYDQLPSFAKEYLNAKSELFLPSGHPENVQINLAGATFRIGSNAIYTRDYAIEPYDDVNGVGLLYFASYSKINDKCERIYFEQQNRDNKNHKDWAQNSSCIARDIFYFGNANPNEALIYQLDTCQLIDEDKVQLGSSLYRRGDGHLIAKIFTIKQFSEKVINLRHDRLMAV